MTSNLNKMEICLCFAGKIQNASFNAITRIKNHTELPLRQEGKKPSCDEAQAIANFARGLKDVANLGGRRRYVMRNEQRRGEEEEPQRRQKMESNQLASSAGHNYEQGAGCFFCSLLAS